MPGIYKASLDITELRLHFILWGMTAEQRGEFIDVFAEACMHGQEQYVRSFPFVRYIRFEKPAKRYPHRTPIAEHVRDSVLSIGVCAFCGRKQGRAARNRLTVDHITAFSKGGTNDRENLRCLCLSCNARRGNR